jgi:hypothetical protein
MLRRLPAVTTSAWPAVIGLVMMVVIIGLLVWCVRLLDEASQHGEFSLTLAGCMVGSAAIGLATVMVITLTGPQAPLVHVFR